MENKTELKFSNEKMTKFVEKMMSEMAEHNKVYGDSWSEYQTEFLEQRMTAKHTEFKLTHNPKKLISLANLVMLLYIRMVDDYENK